MAINASYHYTASICPLHTPKATMQVHVQISYFEHIHYNTLTCIRHIINPLLPLSFGSSIPLAHGNTQDISPWGPLALDIMFSSHQAQHSASRGLAECREGAWITLKLVLWWSRVKHVRSIHRWEIYGPYKQETLLHKDQESSSNVPRQDVTLMGNSVLSKLKSLLRNCGVRVKLVTLGWSVGYKRWVFLGLKNIEFKFVIRVN